MQLLCLLQLCPVSVPDSLRCQVATSMTDSKTRFSPLPCPRRVRSLSQGGMPPHYPIGESRRSKSIRRAGQQEADTGAEGDRSHLSSNK